MDQHRINHLWIELVSKLERSELYRFRLNRKAKAFGVFPRVASDPDMLPMPRNRFLSVVGRFSSPRSDAGPSLTSASTEQNKPVGDGVRLVRSRAWPSSHSDRIILSLAAQTGERERLAGFLRAH